MLRQFLLHGQVGVLGVGTVKLMRSRENGIGAAGGHGQDGGGRVGIGAVKGGRVEVHGQHSLGPYRIGGHSGGIGEICDEKILGHIVVKNDVAAAEHGVFENIPCETNAWTEVAQVLLVEAIRSEERR